MRYVITRQAQRVSSNEPNASPKISSFVNGLSKIHASGAPFRYARTYAHSLLRLYQRQVLIANLYSIFTLTNRFFALNSECKEPKLMFGINISMYCELTLSVAPCHDKATNSLSLKMRISFAGWHDGVTRHCETSGAVSCSSKSCPSQCF